MITHDITKTNAAVRRLIDKTENPRHRFLLIAFDRHRNLEMAGRYDEIFAADMMVEQPVYHLRANEMNLKFEGQQAVKSLYRMWAATNQSVFYTENEQLAVSDNFIASVTVGYQQVSARSLRQNRMLSYLPSFLSKRMLRRALAAKSFKANRNAMYLYRNVYHMIWPYDARGRLLGEDIWEPDPEKAEITKLGRDDVVTTEEAARLLAPLIKPLPSYDEMVLGKAGGTAG
jgi:hypothetical protein